MSHWDRLRAEAGFAREHSDAINKALDERDQLVRALRPFAEAFGELPEKLRAETSAIIEGRGSYYAEQSEIVVRVGTVTIRAGQLAIARDLYEHHTKGGK